ncbi:22.0 kDa heat shock protein-like [Musa acuminata AAA Group]|uniref:22.0 kDa heat shock protein-like n=1 Tax=Musa acuminata AAA Group TaxID=214697 RepID=UPI0031DFDB86
MSSICTHPTHSQQPCKPRGQEMDAKPQTAPADRSYTDLNPVFDWVRGGTSDDILIHLPGFKSDQVRVQIDSHGTLRTSGERPLDGKQWSRFWKDFQLPDNCKVNDVRAKFDDEMLQVHIPKMVVRGNGALPQPADAREPQSKEKAANKQEIEDNKSVDEKKAAQPASPKKMTADNRGDRSGGMSSIYMGLSQARKTLLMNVAVAFLVLFVLGLYLKYKFTKTETS